MHIIDNSDADEVGPDIIGRVAFLKSFINRAPSRSGRF